MHIDRSDEIRALVLKQRIDKVTEFLIEEKRSASRSGILDRADTVRRIYEEVRDIFSGEKDEPIKLD